MGAYGGVYSSLTWISAVWLSGAFVTKVVDDDDDELFLWHGWPMKGILPYFQPGLLSEIIAIANLWIYYKTSFKQEIYFQ